MKYEKKAETVEAVQWTGKNLNEILEFCVDYSVRVEYDARPGENSHEIKLSIGYGEQKDVNINGYIIKQFTPELRSYHYSVCSQKSFERLYTKKDD